MYMCRCVCVERGVLFERDTQHHEARLYFSSKNKHENYISDGLSHSPTSFLFFSFLKKHTQVQRRNATVQKHQVPSVGPGWADEHPPLLALLLPQHRRHHLCGGLCRCRPPGDCQAGIECDAGGRRVAGLHFVGLCQQAGSKGGPQCQSGKKEASAAGTEWNTYTLVKKRHMVINTRTHTYLHPHTHTHTDFRGLGSLQPEK